MQYTKKALATRERIVDAAEKLIFTLGLNRMKLAEVLNSSRVQKGNFYYYFASKEELGLIVLRERGQKLLAEWLKSKVSPAADAWENINKLMAAATKLTGEEGGNPIATLILELSETGDDFRREVAVLLQQLADAFQAQLKRLVSEGRIAAGADLPSMSLYLVMTVEGLLLHKRMAPSAALATAEQFVLRALRTQSASA
jgi:TetR/AcrR family transcriptional regulator, transcriptional repressor for nem operon